MGALRQIKDQRERQVANCYNNDLLEDRHYLLENYFVLQQNEAGTRGRQSGTRRGSVINVRTSLKVAR